MRWEETVERDAQAAMACWIEDCASAPPITRDQLAALLHHVEVVVFRQRTEYHEDEA